MQTSPQPVAVTKLRAVRELRGTDMFCQYYTVVNMPGVTAVWVGRYLPTDPGDEPKYETLEQAWFYRGEDFYSLEDVIAAIADDNLRDRIAEALRRLVHGLMRPLWRDMTDDARNEWRRKADALMKLFGSFDIQFALKEKVDG